MAEVIWTEPALHMTLRLLMKKHVLFTLVAVFVSLLFSSSEVLAQGDVSRFEVGGQFSLLSRNRPSTQFDGAFPFDDFDEFFPRRVSKPGVGARFTYNMTTNLALEIEGNFFPERKEVFGVPDGKIFQCQFGLKAGKRFKKVGFFGKARPGFVTFTQTSQFTGFQAVFAFHPSRGRDVLLDVPQFRIGAATTFSTAIM